ncbi:hypothetical protein BDZ85DRAFT_31738 [Elsinoe ampelina]|uniref:Nephrocystin 3-like N-terminal domain-containing protein n=1 Tax=Elsinoe ampelina TaxID=302913 RepID=A0A6A6G3E3_9PEZI|nr:hypothetical protein BDZ85DRAFT_31738 [Elsinoe ampelina]
MISKAHEATFRWVFDSSVDHSWDPFPSWLADAEDRTPYWISGKPGAGKSTLVQYIERHSDLKAGLKTAFPASDVHIVSHYLWLAGATIKEKSVEGILRSLLFQVIKHYDDCGDLAGVVGGSEDWTPRLLRDALISSVEASGKAWLIILDGLDEAVDDMRAIVELVDQLSAMQQTKVLASGRTLQPLERYFESSKKMRVQDLTKDDIRAYLEERLGKVLPADDYITRKDYRRLVEAGVSQSQGVFLWVKVATNAVLEAIEYREPVKDIHKLLQELPSDLDAMFAIMLSRLGPRNEAQALIYFQLMLSADQTTGDLNLIQLAAMDLICPDLRGPSPTLLTSAQVIEHTNAVRSFATGRCGNFVEVTTGRHSLTEELTFVHRTAHDFLRGYFSSSGCKFSSLDARFLLAEAQVHLVRIADDDCRIMGAVAGYRQVYALLFMSGITEDPQRRLETTWNDIAQSSHHLMQRWNQRLGLDLKLQSWPQSMRHMGFITCHFDDGWQILQDPDRVQKLLANRYFYQKCHLPRDIALDSTGAACGILLDHVSQQAVTTASIEELTYQAFCCLGWEPLDNELQQISTNRRHFPGLLVESLSKLMQAGALIDLPRGHVVHTLEDMYGHRQYHYDSYWDHDSLWKTFVVNTTIFSSRDGRHELDLVEGSTQMLDMLDLFKLFVAHGAAISGTGFTVDMQPQTEPFRTGHLRFACNLSATFCRRASHNRAWTQIATYVWEMDPRIDVHPLGFEYYMFDAPLNLGELILSDTHHLIEGPLDAFANLTEQPWCPYQPAHEEASRVKTMLDHVWKVCQDQANEIKAKIIAHEIKWAGDPIQGPSHEAGFVTHFEYEGLQWEWRNDRNLDPDTLLVPGVRRIDGIEGLSEEEFPVAPWYKEMVEKSLLPEEDLD